MVAGRLDGRAYQAENLNGSSVAVVLPRAIDTRFFGIVPDGVARVTRDDGRGRRTATVYDNTYRLVVPGCAEGPGDYTWEGADGRTIRRYRR